MRMRDTQGLRQPPWLVSRESDGSQQTPEQEKVAVLPRPTIFTAAAIGRSVPPCRPHAALQPLPPVQWAPIN